jgi:hypothetical protein
MKLRYALPLAYVSALVGIGVWSALDPKGMLSTTRKGRKKIEKATGKRLPRPDVILIGPSDEETFGGLDEMVCESAIEINLESPGLLVDDQEAFVDQVAVRALGKLFPDYPWPATSGDHPSAAEIQGLVKYEVRRSILDETLCLDEGDLSPIVEDDDQDNDNENFIPPPMGL